MVVLYAARHRLPVPSLARCLLALGIVATLAANVAHGWSSGPVGAVVAAWPAASLVGSYELLLWLIRTAAAGAVVRGSVPDHGSEPADHPLTALRLVPATGAGGGLCGNGQGCPLQEGGPLAMNANQVAGPARTSGGPPFIDADPESGHAGRLAVVAFAPGDDINAAAVVAYKDSITDGPPLSERKLAAMFGKTSRRWARKRMAEARQEQEPVIAGA